MIQVITTGGTIEGLDYSIGQNKPNDVSVKIEEFLRNAKVIFDFAVERAFCKDSPSIDLEDRELLFKNSKQVVIKNS